MIDVLERCLNNLSRQHIEILTFTCWLNLRTDLTRGRECDLRSYGRINQKQPNHVPIIMIIHILTRRIWHACIASDVITVLKELCHDRSPSIVNDSSNAILDLTLTLLIQMDRTNKRIFLIPRAMFLTSHHFVPCMWKPRFSGSTWAQHCTRFPAWHLTLLSDFTMMSRPIHRQVASQLPRRRRLAFMHLSAWQQQPAWCQK